MINQHVFRRICGVLGIVVCLASGVLGGCHEPPRPLDGASHKTLQQAVIGGKPDLRYPAVGGLIEAGHTFCTATLIATQVVLTAAHCIDGKGPSNKINFRIDVPSQSSASGYQSHFYELDSTQLHPHPKWTGSLSGGHDIAIVLLKTPVPANVATPLPFNTTPLDKSWEGTSPLFMGFGLIESVPNAISPDTKHAVEVPIIIMRNDEFLTQGNGVGTCHGDSGGPALASVSGRFSVIGVNSYSQSGQVPGSNPPRTRCDGRSGVARVDVYARFVQSYIDQYGDLPGACQANQDCGHCEECGTAANKQCQRKASLLAPSGCQPCSNDATCGGGVCHRFDAGFRCLQRCPADGCCPTNTQCLLFQSGNVEDWFCVPKQGMCPAIACQTEQDCGPGEACTTGTCTPKRPPRSASLCHPCQGHDDCPGDAFCIGPKGSGYCAQTCGDADFCPQGTACQQPYRGTPKQCLAANGDCPIPCAEDKDCPADFGCQNNQCRRKAGGAQGDFCGAAGVTCQTGLACVPTLDGKRCLRPCGVPLGEPGSLCTAGLKCSGTASCYSVQGSPSTCIQPCTADSICKGGTCFNGFCRCKDDADCYEGFICNQSAGLFPTCIDKKLNRACEQGFSCQVFGTERYCAAASGSVAHGQPCDAFHRCRDGLVCIQGKDGARCLEDCTRTRGCTLGGTCSAPKDGISVCVCNENQCPNGTTCTPPFYLGTFGYCATSGDSTQCSNRLECPAGYTCQKGTCVLAPPTPELPPEPTPEPTPEPVTADEPPARPEPPSPDEPAPAPEPPSPDEATTPDAATTSPDVTAEPTAEKPKQGCGCNTHSPTPPSWTLLVFLLLLWGRWASHQRQPDRAKQTRSCL